MKSIRRRLIWLLLGSLLLVWGWTLAYSFHNVTHEVNEWENARLVQMARTLMFADVNGLKRLAQEKWGDEDDDGDPESAHLLRFLVRDANGDVLAGTSGLPGAELARDAVQQPGDTVQMLTVKGYPWYMYSLHDAKTGRTVQVFQRSDKRGDLALGVAKRIAQPLAIAMPLLALLVWISIGRGLAPLKTTSMHIKTRNADNLTPIDMTRAPDEIRPLGDALNGLLLRLSKSIERERAFTADAAHELKTPLAAIKVQAQVALGATAVAEQRLAMQKVVEGVDRGAHLVDQLLLLARLDEAQTLLMSPINLNDAVRTIAAAHETERHRKGINLAVTENALLTVNGQPDFMHSLLDNLIDNAVKYGVQGGHIEVVLTRLEGNPVVIVQDDGPGVQPQDRQRLTDRFYRAMGNEEYGSGLGLSIVARIATLFGASLSFDQGNQGKGLSVRLVFKGDELKNS
ncbi:MAG: ATP-binding protein [Paralcaligenes sp.]